MLRTSSKENVMPRGDGKQKSPCFFFTLSGVKKGYSQTIKKAEEIDV